MNLDHLLHQPAVAALGYALLMSLGQSALVFIVLQFALFLVRKPVQRYRLLYTTMTGLSVLFLVTFFRQWHHLYMPDQAGMPGSTLTSGSVSGRHLFHFDQIATLLPYIGMSYTLGCLLLLLRMILDWQKMVTLKKGGIAATAEWEARFITLKADLGVGPKTRLVFSEKIGTPMMMGWLKPLVILPVALINRLDLQQVETILIHELIHIKRQDYKWNLLQLLMELLLFFNPFAWWLSAAIRREREQACDDQVMDYISEPIQYAEALLALEIQRTNFGGALAAAGNGKKKLLFNRIKRITGMQTTHKSGPQGWITILTLIAIIMVTGAFYKAAAQQKKATKAATTRSDQARSQTAVISKDQPEQAQQAADEQATNTPAPEVAAALNEAKTALDAIDKEQLAEATKSIDKETIKNALEAARIEIEQVDWQEINRSIREAGEAVKAIDWNEIGNQINEGLKTVEGLEAVEMDKVMEEVRQSLEEAVESVNRSQADQRQKMREQSRQTRVLLEQSREKMQQQSRQREAQLREKMAIVRRNQKEAALARRHAMEPFRDTLRMRLLEQRRALALAPGKNRSSIDRLLNDLKTNKLIIDPGNVNIRLTDKALYINGKKQPDAAFNRVKKYMGQTGTF